MSARSHHLAYMDEPWFAVLRDACRRRSQRLVAEQLGISGGLVSQVLNGTGAYGSGQASTAALARRVMASQNELMQDPACAVPSAQGLPPYGEADWFKCLVVACRDTLQVDVARQLGVTPALLSQVLTGAGRYGTGKISTSHFAKRVQERLDRWLCPFLCENLSGTYVVSADDCRRYGHGEPCISSYLQGQHWKACQTCPRRPAELPPATAPTRKRSARSVVPPPTPALTQGDTP